MDALASTGCFDFDAFRPDRRGAGLLRRDEAGVFVPVAIGSRASEILFALVSRPGEVVSKREIIAAVWPRSAVEDSNLTVSLEPHPRCGPQFRKLHPDWPGRQYRFTAAVRAVPNEERACRGARRRRRLAPPA